MNGAGPSRLWSPRLRALAPYVPGEQPASSGRLIKLNTNESPFPPSPRVLEAIASVTAEQLRRYPDSEARQLRAALGSRQGLSAERVFVGNGSDEVLALAFLAFFDAAAPLRFPDITYGFYPVWCQLYGLPFEPAPLREDFSVDLAALCLPAGGVLLPNPNAPTGLALSLADIEALLVAHRDRVVIIDEAYVDFGADSACALVDAYDNLLVTQTLSKSRSLAGLRVGCAYGQEALVEALGRVKNSFNSYPVDAVAQAAAVAAVEDEAYFRVCSEKIVRNREMLREALAGLGFETLPSRANFLFTTHPGYPASKLFQGLRDDGIVVRYFDRPRIDEYLRITVGTEEENCVLLESLARLLASATA